MEGYLWKKGRKVPSMKRHYAVLKGTMLAFYATQDEAKRSGALPKRVLEVIDLRTMSDSSHSDSSHQQHIVLKYLDADGGGTLQCRADSKESQQAWMEAFQHALKEPERMAQEEIAEVQEELMKDAQLHSRAVQQATEAVEAAGRQHREQAKAEAALQQNRHAAVELNTQLETAQALQKEAQQKLQTIQNALEEARHRAHTNSMESDDAASFEQSMEAVERIAAKAEVAASAEATHGQYIEYLQEQVNENAREQKELALKMQQCAEESKALRLVAAKSLEDAQRAKQRSRRLASWGDKTTEGDAGSARPSQLDPLVEGYLLCQHPLRSSMHRRYYVLIGNTLCWYMDQDAFINKMDSPSGVLHVAEVAEWDGKVKATSPLRKLITPSFSGSPKAHSSGEPYLHAFAVLTVEGKTLRCSAPLKKNQEEWIAALHVGLTMPPLSPHRAKAARARRDSFDLLASTPLSPRQQSSPDKPKESGKVSQQIGDIVQQDTKASEEPPPIESVVKGYLVGKSSSDEPMKKMFCILRGLELHIFSSHQEAATTSAACRSFHVCGVSSWDGHAALMHYDHGFTLQTTDHASIYCSAPSLQERNCWGNGVQQELLRLQKDSNSSLKDLNRAAKAAGDEEDMKKNQPTKPFSYNTARSELLSVLQKFYAEHQPSKLGDVPLQLSRYQGREQALVEHLDRLYGTTLGKDINVQGLLVALKESVPSPASPRTTSLTQSGPASPISRSSKDLTDWLIWNNDSTASYCVLSGNRLERFESEERSQIGSPLAVFIVTGIHDYPAPSPTMNRSTGTDQQLQFFVSGGYEQPQEALHSSTELLVLQTSTAEAKQKWMTKLRSTAGGTPERQAIKAATTTTTPEQQVISTAATVTPEHKIIKAVATIPEQQVIRAATEVTTSKPEILPEPKRIINPPAKPASKPQKAPTLRTKLLEFYEQHNPKRVGDIDSLLASFTGRERQLLTSLDSTYGTNLSGDGSFDAVLPPASPSRESGQAAVLHREGYLSVKHPRLGASYRKCFCVLDGINWQCFDSSVVAHSGHSPLLSDVIVSLHPVTAKLAEALAFQLETQTNGVTLLRCDTAENVHDWIHALRTVVASIPPQTEAKGVVSDKGSSFQQLRALIVAFYEKHNPTKVSEVDTLLQSFAGREGALLEQIDTVYRSNMVTDPVCTSLCADLAAKHAEASATTKPSSDSVETPVTEAIIMEGYLVKRGHRIPSMRKRYCVLIGNELSYYVTHDDSKNPGGGATTARLGNLLVESVSDWHGKTSTRTYAHGMELETSDGKTFFCAASSAQEKQQWVEAFRHGIALARNQQRQADLENSRAEDGAESEQERQLREQFREKLADFYRVRNPAKLPDLDLLLSCYAQRELALLQAIDSAYGTSLATDENMLTLLPPLPDQASALATLKLDGYLKKTAGDSSNSLWSRAQTVYVAVNGVMVSLFASREGFKSGGVGLREGMTIMSVKDDDSGRSSSAVNRFSIETSEHEWLRFEARDIMEKRMWMQVIRAALDNVLAQTLLAEERLTDRGAQAAADVNGFLLLRLDFDVLQKEHWKRREVPTPIEERFVALENGNEFVIVKSSSSEKQGKEQARFHVVSTRAWAPSARCWPVTASARAPRFPFQIVTQEQFVLSCSAGTDAERANWIRQMRLGAEQAAALEMLEEQLLETKAPKSPGRRNSVDKKQHNFSSSDNIQEAPSTADQKPQEEEEPPMTGYLSFRLDQSSPGLSSQMTAPHEGFIVLTMRARIAVYEDEDAYYRRDFPTCTGQATELLPDGIASVEVSAHSPKTKSRLRHLFPGPKETHASLSFAVVFNSVSDEVVSEMEQPPAMVEFFPTLPSQRDLWLEAFGSRIDMVRGEALLADEKIMMKLEQEDEHVVEEVATAKESSDESDDGVDETEIEEKAPAESVAEPYAAEQESEIAHTFAFRSAAMEGILTPWQTSTSPIRIPGSSKMRPIADVYAVLVDRRLCCYSSKETAAAAAIATASMKHDLALEGLTPSLDVEIAAGSTWDPPTANWLIAKKDDLGFKVDVKASRQSVCFTAPTSEEKAQWLQVMQHELDFVRAERSLSITERAFTREVAAHLAVTAANAGTDDDSSVVDTSEARTEGYLRVRHHNLGSIWRDRFAVLEGSRLAVYNDPEEADVDKLNDTSLVSTALEKHELVGVEKWHPVFTSIGRTGSTGLKGTGFRVETSSGVYLECIASTEEDATRWRNAISAATTKQTSDSLASRDATLPFIAGARMEGYIKLKDHVSKKTIKMKGLKQWKTRYCVVVGSHWLVYANQQQAISSGEAPTPVAVYEFFGVVPVHNEDEKSVGSFWLHVVPGRQVKCKARSSLERKRWLNAVEDELQSQAKTNEDLARSARDREDKQAARDAVKTKMQEMKSEARRLSALLGEAMQSAQADSDYESDANDDFSGVESDTNSSLRRRSRADYIDGSPESSPMRRTGDPAFPFDADITKPTDRDAPKGTSSLLANFFACFFTCIPVNSTASSRSSVAPLGIPGFPSTAAACNPQYTCDYYKNDGYQGLAD